LVHESAERGGRGRERATNWEERERERRELIPLSKFYLIFVVLLLA
jgi:hypothetical protein